MSRVVRWLIGLLLLIGIGSAIAWALRPQPVMVETAEVIRGPMQLTVEEEGQTRIRERYVVSSPLMGRVRRIMLDPGDAVVADDTSLAVIEPTDPGLLDARALAEAEARVRAAEASVRQAGANLERVRVAHEFAQQEEARVIAASERDAATVHELQEARTAVRITAEELRAAQFAEEIAQYELEVARSALLYAQGGPDEHRPQMTVKSPISGVVLRVLQESVAVITPGTPLIEIGDPRDLEIVIDVLSTDAVQIEPGDKVLIEHWGGDHQLEAIVRLVEPSAFTKFSALGIEEQRVNVVADFLTPPDNRPTLGDGFRVEASITTWEDPDVLQIPTSAAFRSDGGWIVFLVRDERAELRSIEIGRRNGQTMQILDGLEVGDRVIVHPSDQLRDGTRIASRHRR